MSRALAALLWGERALLAFLAGEALAGDVSPASSTAPVLLFLSASAGLVLSLAFVLVPTRRPRTLQSAEAVALAAILVGVVGDQRGLYASIPYYDKALHLLVPTAITYMLYALSQSVHWMWRWTRVTPVEVAIYIFAITLTLGTLWELFEFGSDALLGTSQQGGPHGANFDTMTDLLADALGALAGATAAGLTTAYGRKHGFDTVSEARQALARRLDLRRILRREAS